MKKKTEFYHKKTLPPVWRTFQPCSTHSQRWWVWWGGTPWTLVPFWKWLDWAAPDQRMGRRPSPSRSPYNCKKRGQHRKISVFLKTHLVLGVFGSMACTTMNACRKCDAIISGANGVFVSWKTIATMSLPANTMHKFSQSLLSERENINLRLRIFVFLRGGLFVAPTGVDGIDFGSGKCASCGAQKIRQRHCSKVRDEPWQDATLTSWILLR